MDLQTPSPFRRCPASRASAPPRRSRNSASFGTAASTLEDVIEACAPAADTAGRRDHGARATPLSLLDAAPRRRHRRRFAGTTSVIRPCCGRSRIRRPCCGSAEWRACSRGPRSPSWDRVRRRRTPSKLRRDSPASSRIAGCSSCRASRAAPTARRIAAAWRPAGRPSPFSDPDRTSSIRRNTVSWLQTFAGTGPCERARARRAAPSGALSAPEPTHQWDLAGRCRRRSQSKRAGRSSPPGARWSRAGTSWRCRAASSAAATADPTPS